MNNGHLACRTPRHTGRTDRLASLPGCRLRRLRRAPGCIREAGATRGSRGLDLPDNLEILGDLRRNSIQNLDLSFRRDIIGRTGRIKNTKAESIARYRATTKLPLAAAPLTAPILTGCRTPFLQTTAPVKTNKAFENFTGQASPKNEPYRTRRSKRSQLKVDGIARDRAERGPMKTEAEARDTLPVRRRGFSKTLRYWGVLRGRR